MGPTWWFGCYKNETMKALTDQWPRAARYAPWFMPRRVRSGARYSAWPVQILTAYREILSGLIEATGPFMWNIRRV